MPITTLDPKTALVVIDLQKGIVSIPMAHPAAKIAARAGVLAAAFRRHRLPVVLVNVAGAAPGRTEQAPVGGVRPSDWTDLVPELDRQSTDITITKRTWGAFTNTDLEKRLRGLGITHIVLAGISTSIGVESTARWAYELGFNVTLAVDAMTDRNADAHVNSVTRIFPRLGETGTTQEILGMLDGTRG